jgi:hypothetical protein
MTELIVFIVSLAIPVSFALIALFSENDNA